VGSFPELAQPVEVFAGELGPRAAQPRFGRLGNGAFPPGEVALGLAQWLGEGAPGIFGAVRIGRRRFRSIVETVEQHGSGNGASLGNAAGRRLPAPGRVSACAARSASR
jgi:hypothetical protein